MNHSTLLEMFASSPRDSDVGPTVAGKRRCESFGCEGRVQCRGYCASHYNRWLRGKPVEGPIAPRVKATLDDMRALAATRDGLCLSDTYRGGKAKVLWQCASGHQWKSTWQNIAHRNSWCPTCWQPQYNIDDCVSLAASRGGRCLSTLYHTGKLEWECSDGHTWLAKRCDLMSGRWCPTCASGRSERTCRQVLEIMFRAQFPKVRPAWLVTSNGGRLELDGYNEGLGIAFEYQGRQHYEPTKQYTAAEVAATQERDAAKRAACFKRRISLIVVPEFRKLYDLESILRQIETSVLGTADLREYARNPPRWAGYLLIPKGWANSRPTMLNQVYSPSTTTIGTDILATMAERRGRCLSQRYTNTVTPMEWECEHGHRWEATWFRIRSGAWCARCAKDDRFCTIEQARELAARFGGECLSSKYKDTASPLQWRCSNGHTWKAPRNYVTNGNWCARCKKNERGESLLSNARRLAEARGGSCLSDRCQSGGSRLQWRCSNGHVWSAIFNSVKTGRWCKTCNYEAKRLCLDEALEIARGRHGSCLSTSYENSLTKLDWLCACGHAWSAKIGPVKRGSWCPKCAKKSASLSLRDAQDAAISRDGKCLTGSYVNGSTKMLWECGLGHTWEADFRHIREGSWCPVCSRSKRQQGRC